MREMFLMCCILPVCLTGLNKMDAFYGNEQEIYQVIYKQLWIILNAHN